MYNETKYNEIICELSEILGVENYEIKEQLENLKKRKENERLKLENLGHLLKEHFINAIFNVPFDGYDFYYLKVRKIATTDTMIFFDGDVLAKNITLKIGTTHMKYDANSSVPLNYFNVKLDDENIVDKLSKYLVMDFDLMKKKINTSLKYFDNVTKHFLPEN